MKKVQYAVVCTFAAVMALLIACSLFIDSDGFSPFENRYLSKKPVFTLPDLFSGKYMDGYEMFLLDNFLLRDLSVMGFQAYANLLYLDLFTEGELVLANVDVDEFVKAGGQEGITTDTAGNGFGYVQESGLQPPDSQTAVGSRDNELAPKSYDEMHTGGRSIVGSPGMTADGVQQAGTSAEQGQAGQKSGENSSAEGNVSAGDEMEGEETEGEETDVRLTNSLVIAGDRVIMPAGASNLDLFGEILSEFAEIMPDLNLYSITGPTSAAFYASENYSTGRYDQSRAEAIIAKSADGVTVVKVFDKLMEHRDEHIYFRSDVHWTALGAYYAYAGFCEASGQEPADIDEDFSKGTYEPFLGGLYAQIYRMPQANRLKGNPERLDYYIPKIEHRLTLYRMGNLKDSYEVDSIINTDFENLGAYKYSCFAWGDQRIERIDTDNPNGRRLLVIKDSYGSAMIPFLAHNYSLIYVIDPKGFNNEGCLEFDAKELIREEGVEDVLFCFSIYGSGRKIIRDSLEGLLLR